MSIILKRIDIPKDGYIPVRIYANGHIWINGSNKGVAIQIPKGHGALVEEHYPGELKAKQPMELFIMYRSADEDTDRFIFEAEAKK